MRSALGLLGLISVVSSPVYAYERDQACATNIYMVEKREHKTAGWERFNEVPDSVPPVMAQIFEEIGTVPIDASNAWITRFFTVAPEMEQVNGKQTRFTWHQKAGRNEVHLVVTKQQGCIKQIILSYPNRTGKGTHNIESLIQENIIPESRLVSVPKNAKHRCEMNLIETQRYSYRVNRKGRYAREEDLPPFVAVTLRDFLGSGLHGSERTLYDLGKPKRVKGNLLWDVKDGHGKPYTIEVDMEAGCDKTMTIRWRSKLGARLQVERENVLATVQKP
ncbi:hypothetical protein QKW35_17935 [Pontibacterium granulatum]|uniref:hypothetical protein n=1 Tax=Pontibacterium granulatum TaxID=2036029 RepID=UPI00249C2D38|nr:hypothetical protein [Pontibacterium granulatum]MDI3326260.1 hypothetical protein [Pontibacterium granulatum]